MTAPVKIRRTEDEYIIDPLKVWIGEMEKWGQRVRDDIMALEDAVIDLDKDKVLDRPFRREKKGRTAERYPQRNKGGDPGDPPQDPFD